MWASCACLSAAAADASAEFNDCPAASADTTGTALTLLGRTGGPSQRGAKAALAASPPRKPAADGEQARGPARELPAGLAAPPSPVARAESSDSLASTPGGYTGQVAGALNEIVDHLWPRISNYTTEMLLTEVQPAMQASLPKLLEGMSFHPDKCHLGKNPLEFRRIHIDRERQCTAGGDIDNLAIQARFEWDADCNIFLQFKGSGLGIQGLSIKGVLVLELVGLTNEPPFFEGVRVFMNRAPEIDVRFEGAAEGLLNLTWVRETIEGLVEDAIAGLLVLPNRFGYAIVPNADIFTIKSPLSQGILDLTVWGAAGLPAKERTWLGTPSSDPYVVLTCGTDRFQSQPVFKDLTPKWDWTASMLIQEAAHQRIRLEVFNDRTIGWDDFLGCHSLPLQQILEWGPDRKVTLKLQDRTGGEHRGTVTVSAQWRPLELCRDGSQMGAAGVLYAGVLSAARVPKLGEGTVFWVAAACTRLLESFPRPARETPQVGETPQESTAGEADAEDIERRLAILRAHNLGERDIASILQIEPERLRTALNEASDGHIGSELAGCRGTHEVSWETAFEFPVESVADAEVSFDVMCKEPGKFARSLGTYRTAGASLAGSENCTQWRTVTVPGTDMLLKLKLGTRRLGAVSAAVERARTSASNVAAN